MDQWEGHYATDSRPEFKCQLHHLSAWGRQQMNIPEHQCLFLISKIIAALPICQNTYYDTQKEKSGSGMVVHACDPRTQKGKAEAGVQGQPGLHMRTCLKKKKKSSGNILKTKKDHLVNDRSFC
jgi:hypothetical protein